MWEQIAVRIVIALILRKLQKQNDIEYSAILEELHDNKPVTTIKELEKTVANYPAIQNVIVEMGVNLSTFILNLKQ